MQVYTTDTPAARSGRIKVGIADYAVSGDESTLTTSGLGSCIGVALYDPETGVSGLAHAMLPEADDGSEPAKFVDTGIELLLSEMRAAGADIDRVVAKIAGGSTMFDFTSADGDGSIGDRNVAATRTTLDGFGIDVVAEDVGGSHGRSLELDSQTGDLRVRSAKSGNHVL
ncbi:MULTISPECIES: chemotaxis protein CheD [Haloferax]|uniref:Probable chemoreceptor glutamine deamidase CheD n=3 Tax=Haloferax TaxID=2251 RepID=A0A0K1IS62_HALGI|nr:MULTISPECIES: chemoreceptor glutamine deamidase CheD [Haloferax]AKU07296.1 chemotaxis protein CheD [Haloferax gibbonsii]ELZ71640.1 chemoreceptor glutamine deamidase CheD [Haloferax prahovense DSM 18310]ELZ77297.1 chemoreceptor glutamine deamidase CheD [Haloferax gibbonsii ATCC 33959]QOS11374.1 taxis cluster protein CheD [Haloferax gibbonsii]RDZ45785.1 chemotaxis protein CheD [Haloferax sp. Atlit-19N]